MIAAGAIAIVWPPASHSWHLPLLCGIVHNNEDPQVTKLQAAPSTRDSRVA